MKPLIVVLVIAGIVFALAKREALKFTSARDFTRRRNLWFFLTAVAFLSPSFWVFALLAVPLYFWGGRKDSNPLAFFLMFIQLIPAIPVSTPILITTDNVSLLEFFVLIPAYLRLRMSSSFFRPRSLDTMDWCVLSFGVLQSFLFIVPDLPGHAVITDSVTNCLRRGFLFATGNLMIYLVASRCMQNVKEVIECFAVFCLCCLILAGLAVFESLRSWYLYSDLGARWTGDLSYSFYLFRGASLRAKASANTTLELGYLFVIAVGFWLYISTDLKSAMMRWSIVAVYCLGLLATYSRGPWIGACTITFIYLWIRNASFKSFIKLLSGAALFAWTISLTPIGNKIASVFPTLGGQVDEGNIAYRERLFDRCLELIKGSPIFGDQWAYFKMEDLRQGQGIIDFVNAYAEEAVFYGLVGMALLFSPMLVGLLKSYRAARLYADNQRKSFLGFCIVACIFSTLVMLTTVSFIGDYVIMFYLLIGLASAYCFGLDMTNRQNPNAPSK